MLRSKFIFSYPGLGNDCYRLWEAIYSGCIPIVLAGMGLEGTTQGLPVLFVDDFLDVTVASLETAYADIMSRHHTFDYARLTQEWWDWWLDAIKLDPTVSDRFLQEFRSVPSRFDRNNSYFFHRRTLRDCPTS